MNWATAPALDILASVDDEEIRDIERRKKAALAHVARLQDELHWAESTLAGVLEDQARWVEETRRFMQKHEETGLLSSPEWSGLEPADPA